MLSPQESIGVQALSIRIAYLLCRQEPELLQELQLILENTELDFYSTGVRTTVRNTLKKIRATKGRKIKQKVITEIKSTFFCFLFPIFPYLCHRKDKGVPRRAEIIPSNLMQLVLP